MSDIQKKIDRLHIKADKKQQKLHIKAEKQQEKYRIKEEKLKQKLGNADNKSSYTNSEPVELPKWDRLDNTAHLFPVIAGEHMTNVYRMCVVLSEPIVAKYLDLAINKLLPWFQNFNSVLRQGMFWYYFEENSKPYPPVSEEHTFPCQYFAPNANRDYLFRVSYYDCRINLEVFHVLTDGSGARNFLRELVYQYLGYAHPELVEGSKQQLSSETSLNIEDSFEKNYRNYNFMAYKSETAYLIKGTYLKDHQMGIIRGKMKISDIKAASKKYDATLNEFIVALVVFGIYRGALHKGSSRQPITVGVPVDLRPYFNSDTTKNFFVMVSAKFHPLKEQEYHFEDIIKEIKESLRAQITKDNLEKVFSFTVGNEKIFVLRTIPLIFKRMGIKAFYKGAARKNTTTVTNIGTIDIKAPYKQYVKDYYCFLSRSYGQDIKASIASYDEYLSVTFSSVLEDTSIQREFFRKLSREGIDVTIESNGVYYG